MRIADTSSGNLAITRGGATAPVTPKLDELKSAPGTPVDLYLMTSTEVASAPQATLIIANSIYYPIFVRPSRRSKG